MRKPIDRGGILLDGWNEHGPWGGGTSAFYVNCDRKNRSPLGQLMYDFSCTDPKNMYYDELAERVRFFKEDKEGIAIMCKAMEDMRNESLQEGKKEEKRLTVLRMLEIGKYALEEIAEIAGLPLDEVKKAANWSEYMTW